MTGFEGLPLGDHAARTERNWKKAGTSSEAAASSAQTSAYWRAKCLEVLGAGDFTADEIADRLEAHILTIRPRCSELTKAGLIKPSGERRINEVSGKRADVLTLAITKTGAAALESTGGQHG